mgnify:CR=1 FL=1
MKLSWYFLNSIKKFILKSNLTISEKDIEVICEEYWDLIGYYKISERNTWLGIKRDELAGELTGGK